MKHSEKRLALRRLHRGDPRYIIRLYEAQVAILKQEFSKSTCHGCAKGFYERKIKKYEEEIRMVKEDKRFRGMNLNEKKV